MKYLLIVVLFLFLFLKLSNAQDYNFKLSSKRNSDKSVDIEYVQGHSGYTTVSIKFNNLSNSNVNKTVFSVNGFSGSLMKLKPINIEQSINLSYSYRFIKGKLNPKISTEFVYALPYLANTKVLVNEAYFVGAKYFGNKQPDDWKVFVLLTDVSSVVLAARKGIVMEVNNDYDEIDFEKFSYSSKTNDVVIEHEDGSIANYKGFKKGSIKVKVGETVIPSQELGINIQRSNNKHGILFSVYYLKDVEQIFDENKSVSTSKSYYGWVDPIFITNQGHLKLEVKKEYNAQINDQIIQKELTKRELKKFIK